LIIFFLDFGLILDQSLKTRSIICDPKRINELDECPSWNQSFGYISTFFIGFCKSFFVGVEEDEVFTLDYPMDSIIGFFSPLENSLHQILANQILHQEIFANICVEDFSN